MMRPEYRATWRPAVATAILTVALLFLAVVDPAGNTVHDAHLFMEVSATALALCAAALAGVRFRGKPRMSALLVAAAFAGAAALDGVHVLFSLSIWPIGTASPQSELMEWSWLASRFVLAFVLLLATLSVGPSDVLERDKRVAEVTTAVVLAVLVGGLFILILRSPLPPLRSAFPDMRYPFELVPGFLFGLAAWRLAVSQTFRHDPFEHGLLIGLSLSAIGQILFATFSQAQFDARFDAAHLLKVASYLSVVFGGAGTLGVLYRSSNRYEFRLQTEVATRERAESQIKLFEDVVLNMQLGLAVVRQGESDGPGDLRLVACNPAASNVAGVELGSKIGLTLEEVIPGLGETGLPSILMDVLEAGEPVDLGEIDYRKLGADRVVDMRLFPLPDRSLGITFEDVTARRVAVEAIETRERELAEAQALARVGSWTWDVESDTVAWSDEMYRLFAYQPDAIDVTFKVFLDHVHPDDRQRIHRTVLDAAEAREKFKYDFRIIRSDGVVRRFKAIGNVEGPVDGPATRLSGTVQDVTEVAEAEESLRAFARRLESSNRELESFASVASHDLQEPLRKIIMFGERLRDRLRDRLVDDEADYFERMTRAAQRMQRLINDLLDLSRVGKSNEPFALIDLNHVLEEVLSDLEPRIVARAARVDIGGLPSIHADPTQIHQLFLNLIGNALKFVREDVPPIVSVRGELVASDDSDAGRLRIEVADNGLGFDERYSERIFEPFERLHGRQTFEGAGMGLAICRRIVERHDGAISANGRPGEGTTIVVILPILHTENPRA